jgi:hypothetical protein
VLLELLIATAVAVLAPEAVAWAQPKKATVDLRSDQLGTPGLPLAESAKGVYGFRLTAQVDNKGEGSGVLELDPNAPAFDEFGFVKAAGDLPPVKLDCTLKFVKKSKFRVPLEARLGAPTKEVEWLLVEVRGPKIVSRLFLATPTAEKLSYGLLLVQGSDGKVKYVVAVSDSPARAGTTILPLK